MKGGKGKWLNLLLIVGPLLIVLIIGLSSGNDLQATARAIASVPGRFLLLCAAAWLGYLGMDALAVWFFLRRQERPISLAYAIFVAIIGQYYSNITPGATGGQPMQVYYLRKKNIPIALGTSALLVKLFCFQFMLWFLGTLFWIIYPKFIADNVGNNMWILIIGYSYNAVVVIALMLIGLKRNIVEWIVNFAIRVGTKIHFVKDPEASRSKWSEVVDSFHTSITLLRKRPWDLLLQLLIGGLQLLSLMMVIWILYKGFGLSGTSWGQIIALGIMIYTSAGYTPLPGASGAQEGVFTLYLAKVFPDDIRFSALLLWRFFTYYVSLLLGAIMTVFMSLRKKKEDAEPTNEESKNEELKKEETGSTLREGEK